MNRTNELIRCIEACQKINSLYKHIVIDYSSERPIEIENENITIYRVENENSWSITRAYNAGLDFIETEYILKVDADVIVDADYLNKLLYTKYDHILFTNNENDAGNFLVKNDIIQAVNGWNEYIYRGYDDHDLLKRINNKFKDLNVKVVNNKISKLEHGDEERVKSKKSRFLIKNENYHYALVKAANDFGGHVSARNLWDEKNRRKYCLENSSIYIKHKYSYKDLGIINQLNTKRIFLSTFFRIYFRRRSDFFSRLFKRLLPILLLVLPEGIIDFLFGFRIAPKVG